MTRKDYQMIADSIKESTHSINVHVCNKDRLIALLSNKMREDNPNFDGERFLLACN